MKIQIFSGTFSLHRYFLKNRVWPLIKSVYKDYVKYLVLHCMLGKKDKLDKF
jgi:hypothetical protein